MKEEIWHRENAKKLGQLKREVYEAKKLEEERMAKELAANEVLLRERMQSKYTVLEERKREAREQQRLQELRRDAEGGGIPPKISARTVPRGRARGRRYRHSWQHHLRCPPAAGRARAVTTRADAAPEAVRRETVRAAQERLDQAVMAGEVPDQESLLQIEQSGVRACSKRRGVRKNV